MRLQWPILSAIIFILLSACDKKNTTTQLPAEIKNYIYSYTSGVISKTAPITIQFNQPMVDASGMEVPIPSEVLQLSPAVEGTLSWDSPNTLRFDPLTNFETGATYSAKLKLEKLLPELSLNNKYFNFDFQIRKQMLEFAFEGLNTPNPENLGLQEFKGKLFTIDVADPTEVEKVLSAQQGAADLSIEWEHLDNQMEHLFIIKNIKRDNQASQVQLSWDGSDMKVAQTGEEIIDIPALGDFKVTNIESTPYPNQYVSIRFSDPLLQNQNLSGLIAIAGQSENLKYIIDGQEIRVFPSQKITGVQSVEVFTGVKNAANAAMPRTSKWSVSFREPMPEIKLVGQGVIVPNSEGLFFPFEAVGLTAVDIEIFKVHNNNVLQFLQSNQLNGSSSLYQVGDIILQKKVELSSLQANNNTGKWTRYYLDLGALIEQDPKAIYQVRIGFQPAYTIYSCSEGNVQSYREDFVYTTEEEEEPRSMMENWYGIAGYYSNYSYKHRRNPCYTAYYNTDKFIRRNVIASNLGIITKGSDNKDFFAVVTDLRTTAPVSGAKLSFYSFQQQLIGSTTTDAQGMAKIKLDKKPFVVVAEQSNDIGYLRLGDGDALSNSRFDVSGQNIPKGLKGFLYAERGVWRPGDSIYLNFILNKADGALPANYPINIKVSDARGQTQIQTTSIENVNGVYPIHFKTDSEAPTGNWVASVKAGGAYFTKVLKVETIQPNRLAVELDFGGEMLSKAQEPIGIGLSAKWLFGAPARGLKARVEMQMTGSNTTFEKYPSFEFDDPARKLNLPSRVIFESKLDNNGQANINKTLLNNDLAPGKLNATFRTRVFEEGGSFSTDVQSINYLPYDAFSGVEIPTNKYNEKRVDKGRSTPINFMVVDDAGNPIPNRTVTVGLYRVRWRWWWENSRDNISQYNSATHYNAEETLTLTTDNNGKISWNTTINKWGRYMIRVCDEEGGHCSGDFFYVGYPWDDENAGREEAAMLNFVADKNAYQVGEDIELTVPAGEAGKILVTLENGSNVIDQFWVNAQKGDNIIGFKAEANMSPNVYAHVMLLQPHAQTQNDLPIRMYGILPLNVDDPNTYLEPKIEMLQELKPEEKFNVQISESNGLPMTYTIAVVDEGLLGLTRFKTPDPHTAFYAKEALGIRTWDVFDQVLGAYGGQLNRVLSIGGDGEGNPSDNQQDVNRFDPVVMHLGPFFLDANKSQRHELQMPNYVGAVRTMVVASHGKAFGKAEKTTPVRKPLMLLATLPRVLGPGETLKLPVNLFTTASKIKTVTVDLEESSGLINIADQKSKTVRFSRVGQELVEFDLEVAEKIGVAKFKITARGGGETASQEIEILIRNPNPFATEVVDKTLDPGSNWTGRIQKVGMDGTNESVLEVSTLPPLNLDERLDYVIRYPYGCIEQTVSSGFPQLYLDKLTQLDSDQKQSVKKNIEACLNRLIQFQTSEGGFAYWPGNSQANQWGSSYAGHFMLEAKNMGYTIPNGLINKWAAFQRKVSRLWRPGLENLGYYNRGNSELEQAYRLYTLALAKKPDLSAMNRMMEQKDLSQAAKWRLAAAYQALGKDQIASRLINNLTTEVADYTELSGTYGSSVRDRAMILETLIALGKKEDAAEIVRYISDRFSSRRWYSTQTTAYALMAVSKFVGDGNIDGPLAFSYAIGNDAMKDFASSDYPLMQIELPVERRARENLQIKNNTQGPLFVRLIQRGQPLTNREQATSNDLRINIAYKNTNGSVLDPGNIAQGTDFIAEVSIIHPGSRPGRFDEMVLHQIFPSGWEILNTRLDGFQTTGQESYADYKDFRDDRVNIFFDIREKATKTYRVQLNAAYQGRFYLPAVSCEAMYDHSINAQKQGRWIVVGPPKEI